MELREQTDHKADSRKDGTMKIDLTTKSSADLREVEAASQQQEQTRERRAVLVAVHGEGGVRRVLQQMSVLHLKRPEKTIEARLYGADLRISQR